MDLQNRYQDFQNRRAEIIAVAVQNRANAQKMVTVTGAAFPILADPDHVAADAFGVFNLLGDGAAAPAVFIINQTGQIVWQHIGQNSNDRPAVQAILDNLPD